VDIFDLFRPSVEKLEARGDVEGLIKTLHYKKDLKVRWEAVKALSRIGEPSVEAFVHALKDESELIRREAAVALGEIKDEKAVKPLFQALKDESKWVQEGAVEALGKIGEPPVESLIQALKDESEGVRRRATELLGKMRFSGTIQTFETIFERFGITQAQEASIFYILSVLAPSLNFTETLREAVKIKRTVSQGALKKGRDYLLNKGFLAMVLFTHDTEEEFEQNDYIPVHPKIIFEENKKYLREIYEPEDFLVRKKQIEDFYGVYEDNYGKYGLKMEKGCVTLYYSDMWLVSYISSLIIERSSVKTLSLMLSGFRVFKEAYRQYYTDKIGSGLTIRMIFGGEEEIEEIKALRNEHEEHIEIRYTPSISRMCKSFIVDDKLAMDSKKLLPMNREGLSYIGTLYIEEEECIKNLRRDFENVWTISKALI
jgi:hypothetical protein